MVRFSKKKSERDRNETRPKPSTPVHLGKRTPLNKQRVPSSKRSIKTEPSVMPLATNAAQFYRERTLSFPPNHKNIVEVNWNFYRSR